MLKLTYHLPNDVYQTVTVLGDAAGLWDLWFRLTEAHPNNANAEAAGIQITTLGGMVIDPRKGLENLRAYDQPLSRLE